MNYSCDKCSFSFPNLESILCHLDVHLNSGLNVSCPVPHCGKRYAVKSSLRNHCRIYHCSLYSTIHVDNSLPSSVPHSLTPAMDCSSLVDNNPSCTNPDLSTVTKCPSTEEKIDWINMSTFHKLASSNKAAVNVMHNTSSVVNIAKEEVLNVFNVSFHYKKIYHTFSHHFQDYPNINFSGNLVSRVNQVFEKLTCHIKSKSSLYSRRQLIHKSSKKMVI